ncbi:acyloxyacyl hydrolase [Thalassobius vesicularis]|uniref:Acyloxyacyl hydrolase n=1 Tax=Thalassobius vesicularis TaxID=1294297 RepID=A0A4S3M860_9RHOB|nr:acyloxyacyl hydrolase [Thalassobius vesicularis]THD71978.1 acyloxyacyl hydrolase [Thalassobius vesicularis]
MDGTFAVLFLLAGLADMKINHCATGCLAQSDTPARIALSAGDVQFQKNSISEELYVRYDFNRAYGPFQPVMGASITADGSAWMGFGAAWTGWFANNHGYVQLHLMPGIYAEGDGPDLGSAMEFRSGAEIGWQAKNGLRIGLSYDHRSNADTATLNPGLETVQLRVSIPLKK